MKNRPTSVKIVYWMQWTGLSIYGVLIILFGSFFISGGSSWESFKDGLLGSALGIHAQEFNAEYFGILVGRMFIPICLLLISLWSIKKYMFKTLVASTIIHMLFSIAQPLKLLLMVVTLILVLIKSSRKDLQEIYSYSHETSTQSS